VTSVPSKKKIQSAFNSGKEKEKEKKNIMSHPVNSVCPCYLGGWAQILFIHPLIHVWFSPIMVHESNHNPRLQVGAFRQTSYGLRNYFYL
jgi:hypothetical protein